MAAAHLGTDTVEHEIRIAARPETVFGYFTDPARMVEWFGADATLDPRPGGICRITFASSVTAFDTLAPLVNADGPAPPPVQAIVMSGRFVEVEPHHRLVFTWGWEQQFMALPPQSTLVTVSLDLHGDGGTLLRVVHGRLPEPSKAFHAAGWEHYLRRLADAAAGRSPGVDPLQRAD